MVCLGVKPGAAEWKAKMNLLSYGGTPICFVINTRFYSKVVIFINKHFN